MEMPVFTGLPVEGQLIIIASLSFPIQLTNCSWAREEPQRGRGKMSPGCSPVNSLASIISVSNTSTASMGSSAASSELRYRRATFRVNSSIVIIVASFTLGILGSSPSLNPEENGTAERLHCLLFSVFTLAIACELPVDLQFERRWKSNTYNTTRRKTCTGIQQPESRCGRASNAASGSHVH